jgi:polysaccharide export outer membrane protein
MKKISILFIIVAFAIAPGCKNYKSNIILKAEKEDINWSATYQKVQQEYKLRIGDKFQYSIYTNAGEAIIDPSGQLMPAGGQQGSQDGQSTSIMKPVFEVTETGFAFLPVIGKQQIAGLTISELDNLLSDEYEKFYNEVFVVSRVTSRRVIVMGTKGAKVLPLMNNNTNLLEIIALYGGLDNLDKGYNIRIIRGDLQNPEVAIVNLKTIGDLKNSIVNILPDDIVYIEPVRRPVTEASRDFMFIFQFVQVALTIYIILR